MRARYGLRFAALGYLTLLLVLPVGLVFFHASGPMGEKSLRFELPGEREWIRARAAVSALHLVRRLLEG